MHVALVDRLWEGHHTPYVVYLSRYFTERGHRVTFLTDAANPRLGALPDSDRLDVRALPLPTTDADPGAGLLASAWEQMLRVRQLRRAFGAARAAGADVAHLLYFDRTQLPLWAVTRRSRPDPPVVATLHRDAFTDEGGGAGKRLTRRATVAALDATLADGSLARLTVHADGIRDRIVDRVPAATRENTLTIPAPTPAPSIDASPAAAREHLGLPADAPVALFFGGLRAEKGPDLLAEAVRGLDRPLAVVFAGPAGDFGAGDVAGWGERVDPPVRIVDRVGFVPESELDYYFRAADVLVLPYRRRRGISGPLRRACAAGTPVIGNAGSDVGEAIDREGLGWTFAPDSPASLRAALETFLEERGAFPTENLQRHAREHHWEATGEAVAAIYRDVCEDAATPTGRPRAPD